MCYIYSYVNKENGKTYIGSRCKYTGKPEDDFNKKYFSSSNNPEFINDMNNGLLVGTILLEVDDSDKCVKLENIMIKAYWEQYGKDKSYNRHYIIGNENQFTNAGNHKSVNSGTSNPMYGVEPWNKGKKGLYSGHWKGKHLPEYVKEKLSQNHANVSGENNPMYGKHPKQITARIISKNIVIQRSKSQLNRWYKDDWIEIKDED